MSYNSNDGVSRDDLYRRFRESLSKPNLAGCSGQSAACFGVVGAVEFGDVALLVLDHILARDDLSRRFRESLSKPITERFFDEDELVEIFDYAGDIDDAYARVLCCLCGDERFHFHMLHHFERVGIEEFAEVAFCLRCRVLHVEQTVVESQ